jgi:hypothetical protein
VARSAPIALGFAPATAAVILVIVRILTFAFAVTIRHFLSEFFNALAD